MKTADPGRARSRSRWGVLLAHGARATIPGGPTHRSRVTCAGVLLLAPPATAALLAVSALWGWLATTKSVVAFDRALTQHLVALRSAPITGMFRWVTWLGDVRVVSAVVVVTGAAFVWKHRPGHAATLAASTWGTLLLVAAAKAATLRERPPQVDRIVGTVGSALPSGHAALALACFGALAALLTSNVATRLVRSAIWVAVGLLVVAVGFSRVYLGVHWPTDVVSGWVIAVGWVLTCTSMERRHCLLAVGGRRWPRAPRDGT